MGSKYLGFDFNQAHHFVFLNLRLITTMDINFL